MKLLPPTEMKEYEQGNLERAYRRIILEYRDVPHSAGITRDVTPENTRHMNMMSEFYTATAAARNGDLIDFQSKLWADPDIEKPLNFHPGKHSYTMVKCMVERMRTIMNREGLI